MSCMKSWNASCSTNARSSVVTMASSHTAAGVADSGDTDGRFGSATSESRSTTTRHTASSSCIPCRQHNPQTPTHLAIPDVGIGHGEQEEHRRECPPHPLKAKVWYIGERPIDVLPDRRAEVEVREPRLPRIVPVEAQRVNPWRRHRRFGRRRRIPLAAGTVCRPPAVRRDEVSLPQIGIGAARRGERGGVEVERGRRREEAEVELPSARGEGREGGGRGRTRQ